MPLNSWAAPSQIRFRINSSSVDSSYRNNSSALVEIEKALSEGSAVSVKVKATCSPDGPLAFNRYLAKERAKSVVEALRAAHPEIGEDAFKIEVVEEDWSSLEKFLSRCAAPWKEDALAIIRSGNENCKERLQELWVGEAWEVMSRQYFSRLRRAEILVEADESKIAREFANPEELSSGEIRFVFDEGVGWVNTRIRKNAEAVKALKSLVASGASVKIVSYTSPDGSSEANARLSRKRLASVQKILEQSGCPPSRIEAESYGEDWNGLLGIVMSSGLGNKESIRAIIEDESLSSSAKKSAIRSLDGGVSWKKLVSEEMGKLRTVVCAASE